MADKEATVYIVDVGASMGVKRHGREQSDLDWAMTYIWDKITSTVATERKTATLGVVGLNTSGTSNESKNDPGFENISVFQEISQILLPDLQRLHRLIKLSDTDDGDAISAIVIAIQMISNYCKKLKYRRKIVLITNGHGAYDIDDTAEITKKLKEDDIELVILGVDFDDLEYGFKEEAKDSRKAANEDVFRAIAADCDGIYGTLVQAIEELGIPRVKATRPVPSYKGHLTLGDQESYGTAMVIDVERYPRTMIRKPPSASQFVVVGDDTTAGPSAHNPNSLAPVKNSRTYRVDDDEAPGNSRDVTIDQLARGYEYGRTAVPISDSDSGITVLETRMSLDILGFIPWTSYDRYMSMSVSNIIIAQKTNSKAILALSSFIHALFELQSYAIARLVLKDNKPPVLVLLAPSIEPDYECLIDVQLPFAEDVRAYEFAPLDKVVTVSGKILKEHRNLPNDALSSAMSAYVDKMDLSTFSSDEEGKPAEYMKFADTFSPVLHRIDQAIRWRAVHGSKPIPPPYEILTKYSHPPEELLAKTKKELELLIKVADVKRVPPKLKGHKRHRDKAVPLSGLDVDKLLGQEKRVKISIQNPIPEFKQMLDTTEDPNGIQDAANQLSAIIEMRIKDSFGDDAYGQALEELRVLREELIDMEEPGIYNDFMTSLKKKLLGDSLGGDRREMWWQLRKNQLGLIETKQHPMSKVTSEEAKQFLTMT